MSEVAGLAEKLFEGSNAESALDAALDEAGVKFDGLRWDDYDTSLEIDKVPVDYRLSESAQRVIYEAGFLCCYVNHVDGHETHYSWKHGEPFKVSRGWRRRYVSDPAVSTTRVLAGDPDPGYYEISYWPEGWGDPNTGRNAEWLKSGYMRVVPDPLDQPI